MLGAEVGVAARGLKAVVPAAAAALQVSVLRAAMVTAGAERVGKVGAVG